MADCPHCGEVFAGTVEPDKSRCPHCHEPIFERAGGPKLVSEGGDTGNGICAMHGDNVAIGTCTRCGNFLCPVCRSKWIGGVFCFACVERLMGEDTVNPEERRSHRRQAMVSMVLGIIAWVSTILAASPLLALSGWQNDQSMFIFAIMLSGMSLVPSLFGAGQAAAAIRIRGPRMLVATFGLVLCCSHIGLILGIILIRSIRA